MKHGIFAFALAAMMVYASPAETIPAKRRAVLIGINTYSPAGVKPAKKAWRKTIRNLRGAENDVEHMKAVLLTYGWSRHDDSKPALTTDNEIIVLKGQYATRKKIMDVLEKQIIAKATPGETVFFFFSGHGSSVKNTLARKLVFHSESGQESYGISNTIVPADSLMGAPDITDKEMAKEFNRILDKQAKLTAVFDSCYSGEYARGPMESFATKAAPSAVDESPGGLDVKEPDPAQLPYERGALIMSAARYDEEAEEYPRSDEINEEPRGAFAMCLTSTLQERLGLISVRELFTETRARLKALGCPQEPVYECGDPNRLDQDLLGGSVRMGIGHRFFVTQRAKTKDDTIKLQGGLEYGVQPGTVMQVEGTALRAIVTDSRIGECAAKYSEGDEGAYLKANAYTVAKWGVGSFPGLRVYIPRSTMSLGQLEALGASLSSIQGPKVLSDPTGIAPTAEIAYVGDRCNLFRRGRETTALEPGEVPRDLTSRDTLFVNYPLASEFSEQVKFGSSADDMVSETTSLKGAPDYVLTGEFINGEFGYRWIAPATGRTDPERGPQPQGTLEAHFDEENSMAGAANAMPPESDWHRASSPDITDQLKEDAAKLARLKNWATLTSHDDGSFPYHLELWNTTDNTQVKEGGTVLGYPEDGPAPIKYQLKLVLDRGAKVDQNSQSRYYYVMDIDDRWKGILVCYSAENPCKPSPNDPPLNLRKESFQFQPPFGTERFFLLTSKSRLPDPEDVFNFEGFEASRGVEKGGGNPLARLLLQASAGKRSPEEEAPPSTWSIQRLVVTSKPAPQQGNAVAGN